MAFKMIKTEILPVIHVVNVNQALTNVKICLSCGIQKAFFINHHVSVTDLLACVERIKNLHPEFWIGVNMLGLTTEEALSRKLSNVEALWCDATITSENAKKIRNFEGQFFGGLAFKYQPQPTDLKIACEDAILATDVATTSGSATGKAADVEKIKKIREFLGEHPLAIASGVSVDNIDNYKNLANYLLVASSITSRSEMIIEEKLLNLRNKL